MFARTILNIKQAPSNTFYMTTRSSSFWKQSGKDIFKSIDIAENIVKSKKDIPVSSKNEERKAAIQAVLDSKDSDADANRVLRDILQKNKESDVDDIIEELKKQEQLRIDKENTGLFKFGLGWLAFLFFISGGF